MSKYPKASLDLSNPAALMAFVGGDIANAIAASIPGGIEQQEKDGQTQLCANHLFPKDFLRCKREDFEAMGIGLLDQGDPIFFAASLPAGWSIKPTDHSMWSDLQDDTGKKRAAIFYKAAFYDRRAHVSIDQ